MAATGSGRRGPSRGARWILATIAVALAGTAASHCDFLVPVVPGEMYWVSAEQGVAVRNRGPRGKLVFRAEGPLVGARMAARGMLRITVQCSAGKGAPPAR